MAAEGSDGEVVGETDQALYGGFLDDGDGAVVELRVGEGAAAHICSGALVASNLVLTAHHCVAERTSALVTCDVAGQATQGAQLAANVAPASVHVYLGSQPNSSAPALANGRTLFAPSGAAGTALCNADVAFVVLDRAITGVTPLPLRLGAGARAGERVYAVGYGKNDRGVAFGTRQRTEALSVLAHGAGVAKSGTPLGSAEIELGASNCDGDSGGPLIAVATGAIVGVASRDYECAGASGHVYVEPSAFHDVVSKAFAYAGASPLEEPAGAAPASPDAIDLTTGSGRHGCAVEGVGVEAVPSDVLWGALVVLGIVVARRKLRREDGGE